MRIVLPPLTERTEVKTLGDVHIKIVELGNRILSLEIHQSGRVPSIDRFSPEVMQKAQRWWWWSTSRERRILREVSKQGRLNYEIVRQALLHHRAATTTPSCAEPDCVPTILGFRPNTTLMHGANVRPFMHLGAPELPLVHQPSPATRTARFEDIDRGRTRVEYNLALKDAPELTLTEMPA